MDVIASEAKQSPSFASEIVTAYYVGLAMATPQVICDRVLGLRVKILGFERLYFHFSLMSNSKQQDSNFTNGRSEPFQQMPVRLGNIIKERMEQWILPQQRKFESVVQLWSKLMPDELCQHCRVTDISGGLLKVSVDSPSYMYELQLRSAQILAELRRRCPQTRVKKIKITLA